jgi:hypothetical protein
MRHRYIVCSGASGCFFRRLISRASGSTSSFSPQGSVFSGAWSCGSWCGPVKACPVARLQAQQASQAPSWRSQTQSATLVSIELLREMRAIRFVTRLIDDGTVVDGSLRRMRIHTIAADDVIAKTAELLTGDRVYLSLFRTER